jgi:hypothetical protein
MLEEIRVEDNYVGRVEAKIIVAKALKKTALDIPIGTPRAGQHLVPQSTRIDTELTNKSRKLLPDGQHHSLPHHRRRSLTHLYIVLWV